MSSQDGTMRIIPPSDNAMEMAVLGAVILERDSMDRIASFITPDSFYHPNNKEVFLACHSLWKDGKPIDLMTVKSELSRRGKLNMVGGAFYLTELMGKVASAANIEHHAQALRQKFIRRGMMAAAMAMFESAQDDQADVFDVLTTSMETLRGLSPDTSPVEEFTELAVEAMKDVEAVVAGDSRPIFIGFRDIDQEFAFEGGDLVVLGGKSGTGKTSVMMRAAKRIRMMNPDIPVLFNSLEMKGKKIVSRDMASEMGVSQMRFRTGKGMGVEEFSRMQGLVEGYKGIYSMQSYTVEQSRAKVREFRRRFKVPQHIPVAMMFDYIQIAKGEKGGNREQEVASISRALKQMAQEENVLVFAGSQLNKESGNNRPTSSNLRESEGLRNDADFVVLLYSPLLNGVEHYEDGSSTKNVLEAIFDKVRFGRPGTIVKLHMDDHGLVGDLPDPNAPMEHDGLGVDPRRVQPKAIDFGESRHNQEYEGSDRGAHDNFPF